MKVEVTQVEILEADDERPGGALGPQVGELPEAAAVIGGTGRRRQGGRQLLPLEESDGEQVRLDRLDLRLSDRHIHGSRVYELASKPAARFLLEPCRQ